MAEDLRDPDKLDLWAEFDYDGKRYQLLKPPTLHGDTWFVVVQHNGKRTSVNIPKNDKVKRLPTRG